MIYIINSIMIMENSDLIHRICGELCGWQETPLLASANMGNMVPSNGYLGWSR